MRYLEIFAAAVPTAKKEGYIEFIKVSEVLPKENGMLSVVDCRGVTVLGSETNLFWRAVNCDEGMARIARDPKLRAVTNRLPFDGKRMIVGGLEPLSEA